MHVLKQRGRTNLVMRYVDPESGKQVWRTTGTTKVRDALKAAAKWEAELREGRYQKISRMTWQDFRAQYEADVLDGLKSATAVNYQGTLNVFERTVRPGRLAEVTTAKLTAFVTAVCEELEPATVARHLRQLKVDDNGGSIFHGTEKNDRIHIPPRQPGRPVGGRTHQRPNIDAGYAGCETVSAYAGARDDHITVDANVMSREQIEAMLHDVAAKSVEQDRR